jgi:hypothetical protein
MKKQAITLLPDDNINEEAQHLEDSRPQEVREVIRKHPATRNKHSMGSRSQEQEQE